MKSKNKRKLSLKKKVSSQKIHPQKKKFLRNSKKQRVETTVHLYKKEFGKAPEEKVFHLHDGRKIRTLFELVDELETITDESFHEYVNWEHNDFANWIHHVFELPDLAEELRKTEHRHDTQSVLLKHFARELKKLLSV